jgi:hypothetical protein
MFKKKETKAKKPLFKKFGFWFILAAIVVSIAGGGDSDTSGVNLQQAATSMSAVSRSETALKEKVEVVAENTTTEQESEVVEQVSEETEQESEAPVVITPPEEPKEEKQPVGTDYVGNKNTKKFHYSWCNSVDQMKESNKYFYTGTREEMMAKGYKSCGNCHP